MAISIHASAKEATLTVLITDSHKSFQSTPPRGRRRAKPRYFSKDGGDFNPRLREGGDIPCHTYRNDNRIFQSTPPLGRRRQCEIYIYSKVRISIHASAREATAVYGLPVMQMGFQSTPPRGRRRRNYRRREADMEFQSTPPLGRRHICDSLPRFYKDFNPRLR